MGRGTELTIHKSHRLLRHIGEYGGKNIERIRMHTVVMVADLFLVLTLRVDDEFRDHLS